MSLVTPAQFKVRYPEFAALDSTYVVQPALDDADEEINPTFWGARAIKAESALAAHYLVTRGALNDPGSTGIQGSGEIQTMRVGDVTLGFDNTAIADAVRRGDLEIGLASTKYGLEYQRLLQSMGGGGATTGWGGFE